MNIFLVWSVDKIDKWNIKPTCYALSEQGGKCDIELPVIVYKPPLRVSISFSDDGGMMIDGDQYILQCTVHDVAPVEKLIVIYYREQMILGQRKSNNTRKSSVTEVFTLDIQPSKDDDKAQYWCEARLELGPEGPQPPPVMASQKLTAKVLYGPHLICPRKLQVKEGEGLKCEVMGNPHPQVTWIRDGQVVDLPAHSQIEHAGKYTAWTKGLFGEKNFTVDVEIIVNSVWEPLLYATQSWNIQ
uniref:Hemicentin-1-like n=1 Tax=Gouania willdenowi TaxID=441366 RepID=A0A8C5HTN4_GOUWI